MRVRERLRDWERYNTKVLLIILLLLGWRNSGCKKDTKWWQNSIYNQSMWIWPERGVKNKQRNRLDRDNNHVRIKKSKGEQSEGTWGNSLFTFQSSEFTRRTGSCCTQRGAEVLNFSSWDDTMRFPERKTNLYFRNLDFIDSLIRPRLVILPFLLLLLKQRVKWGIEGGGGHGELFLSMPWLWPTWGKCYDVHGVAHSRIHLCILDFHMIKLY